MAPPLGYKTQMCHLLAHKIRHLIQSVFCVYAHAIESTIMVGMAIEAPEKGNSQKIFSATDKSEGKRGSTRILVRDDWQYIHQVFIRKIMELLMAGAFLGAIERYEVLICDMLKGKKF